MTATLDERPPVLPATPETIALALRAIREWDTVVFRMLADELEVLGHDSLICEGIARGRDSIYLANVIELATTNVKRIPDNASRNLRAELKLLWPKIKFWFRSRNGSFSTACYVSWTDGPCSKIVQVVLDRYKQGDFNGYNDSYEYEKGRVWTWGDYHYCFCERSVSDELTRLCWDTEYPGGLTNFGSTTEFYHKNQAIYAHGHRSE